MTNRDQFHDRLAEALEEIDRAYEPVAEAIRAIPDPQVAWECATEFAQALRAIYQKATDLRTLQYGRIWESEEMSLAALAERTSVAKSRADQLVRRAAKLARGEETP